MTKKTYLSQTDSFATSHGASLFKKDADLTVEQYSGYEVSMTQSGSGKDDNRHDIEWITYDCFEEDGSLASRNQLLRIYQDGSWSLTET